MAALTVVVNIVSSAVCTAAAIIGDRIVPSAASTLGSDSASARSSGLSFGPIIVELYSTAKKTKIKYSEEKLI